MKLIRILSLVVFVAVCSVVTTFLSASFLWSLSESKVDVKTYPTCVEIFIDSEEVAKQLVSGREVWLTLELEEEVN